MGGGGGGSWKVAYADFVTAMMAFFLVMWIGAQDTKTRQSVANYFVDPSGVSKKPVTSGAVMESLASGNAPNESKSNMGRGRESLELPGEPSTPSRTVRDWITDDKRRKKYEDMAQAAREKAAASADVVDGRYTAKAVAVQLLAKKLKEDVTGPAAAQPPGVFQDLLYGTFTEVNWTQLAQDLLK